MPTYEYVCRDCSEHVEVVQSFKDAPLTTCGVCGGQLRKVFSAAGIIFKGSGYYVTDTRKKSGSGAASPTGESEPSTKKSDSSAKKSDGSSSTTPKAESA